MMRQQQSLKGLPGVRVVVEEFRRAVEAAGFDSQTFQTDVELKLRMAGIKVAKDTDLPELYLNVNALHRERNTHHAYSISLRLIQPVLLQSQLRSDPEQSSEDALFATTWTTGLLGLGTVADVRAALKDLVDEFVNDWLAVNPLKGTA